MISWPLFTRYSTKVDVIAKDSINVVRDSLQNTHDNEGSNAIEDDSNKEPQSVGKKNEIPEKGSIDITNKLNINVPRTKDAQNSDDKSQAIGLTLNKAKEDNPEEEITEVERQVIEVTVEQGQTAYGIAMKHNMHRPELEKLNPGIDLDKVHPGDKIKVYKK
jgi:LysM repeat protein